MIASEITIYRAASIAGVLAASAFVCAPARSRDDDGPKPVLSADCVSDLDAPRDIATAHEPSPPALGGWQGACRAGEHGWPTMPITLELATNRDGTIYASGRLAFIDRRTRAKLRGGVLDDRFILHGEMKEIGGLGTIWRIEVNGRFKGPDRIVGRFVEVYASDHGNGALMCTFDWQR